MRVIPEDHPSKLPPETLFEQASPEDLPKPFRKVTRVPERPLPFRSLSKPSRSPSECLLSKTPPKPLPDRPSESATCPGSQPEAISPKAPFDTPSNKTLRSFLRDAPRVPRVEPKDSFENDLCPRSPAANSSGSLLRNALGTCHVFPSAERNTSPPGFFPTCHVSPNTPHLE